ncbi:unnamed protein product [Porites evermanni]|uniref:Uncharacterized protein n=1 Tax=Porites evermanni TaxID=104178 RepID=A0ABN8LNL0_9CNID|nr:unnamed protein product [Porites evermanni]
MLFAKFEECNEDSEGTDEEMETDTDYSVSVPTQLKQLTRELEVRVYTGLPSPETSQFSFDYLREKARSMQYWRGGKQTMKEAPQSSSPSSWQLDLPKEDLGLKNRNSKWTGFGATLWSEYKHHYTAFKVLVATLQMELFPMPHHVMEEEHLIFS